MTAVATGWDCPACGHTTAEVEGWVHYEDRTFKGMWLWCVSCENRWEQDV